MIKRMNIVVICAILLLCIGAVAAVINMNNKYDVKEDMSQLKSDAEEIYGAGDIDEAIHEMEIYCSYVSTDIEAIQTLGDWYIDAGREEDAYKCYLRAGMNKKLVEERMPSLNIKNRREILSEAVRDVVIEITPDVKMTKDMTLIITGGNLVPEKTLNGRVDGLNEELTENDRYITTDWFPVDPEGGYITMSGGFNCAVWQIRDGDGKITHVAESRNKYRVRDSYETDVYQMARLKLPQDSAMCRVTYCDRTIMDETADMDEPLTIVYGRLPGESVPGEHVKYDIPDLKEGDKVVYENGTWQMVCRGEIVPLTGWKLPRIERGSYFEIGGTLPGRVSFERCTYPEEGLEGIYTIKFDKKNPSAMGERMDDAKNLVFNSVVGQGYITLGDNQFDNIYPWKDMRLCSINEKFIFYEGENMFSPGGEKGDIFVEIPKFYVKREVDGRYDSISISGTKHEGFEVDPAFVTEDGEADKIYVAAYLSGVGEDGKAKSVPGDAPALLMTPEEIKKAAESKGEGYREIDYDVLSALQKLFMVETGLRNSQYLYLGVCGYTAAVGEGELDYAEAVDSKTKTNCITVDAGYEFIKGNSVIFYRTKDNEGDVRSVTTVIDNEDGTQSVFLSGEPVDVEKGKSFIVHTALINGNSRNVDSHTGAAGTDRGTVTFKYRNIENFWGNTFVYIDNITVKGREVFLTDRRGNVNKLGYFLPKFYGGDRKGIVREIGWDDKMPNVMLPTFADKATTSTYYGDLYTGSDSGEETVVYYGGGWSSKAEAGLFCFDASMGKDEAKADGAGRMILIK